LTLKRRKHIAINCTLEPKPNPTPGLKLGLERSSAFDGNMMAAFQSLAFISAI